MKKLLLLLAFLPVLFVSGHGAWAQGNFGSGPIPNVLTTGTVSVGHVIINDGGVNYVDGGEPMGTGDVNGPASSIINNFASYSDLTGKNIQDSGFSTGTSGAKIPLLNGANAWSALQTFSAGANGTFFSATGASPFQQTVTNAAGTASGTLIQAYGNSGNMFTDGPGTVTLIGLGAGANLPASDYLTTAIGFHALNSSTNTNTESTAVGWKSQNAVTSGGYNTSLGINTIGTCQTCTHDIAIGTDALRNSTTASTDIAIGASALLNDGSAGNNIAIGEQAMTSNLMATGQFNVAIGKTAMVNTSATSSQFNVAIGTGAGGSAMTSAASNVIIGHLAGNNVTSDSQNVMIGFQSGNKLVGSSGQNVFVGWQAGYGVTTGFNNTVIGNTPNANINEITTGAGNILIGAGATVPSATRNGQIVVGNLLYLNAASTASPVLSSCGTSPSIDSHANSKSGTVTVGSGTVASCTITFASGGYGLWNHCRVTSQSAVAALAYSYTLTAITVTATSLTNDLVDYDCDGN